MPPARAKLVPVDLVIVQPSPFCNIDCTYCYLPARSDKRRMESTTVRALAAFLRGVPLAEKPLTIVWHAGEPLTLPVSFYEDAFTLFKSARLPVRHNIQTNATLITDEWCALFKRWNVQVGVSIDGPKRIHDSHRMDRAGRGTFDATMRGVAKLKEHGIPFAVLSVITEKTLPSPDEYWEFMRDLQPSSIGFNIEEAEGINRTSATTMLRHLPAYRRFLTRIDELHAVEPRIRVRELDDVGNHLNAPQGVSLERSDNRPGSILNVDVEGNYTTFSPELLATTHPKYGAFKWGNVKTDPWRSMAAHPGFQRARADIAKGIDRCRRSCDYFSMCGGGCPSNKLAEHGTFDAAETNYCRFHVKVVADVVLEKIDRELSKPNGKAGDSSRSDGSPDLYLLGSGVSFPRQLTMETYDALAACEMICTNLTDKELKHLPRALRAKCLSLWPLYRDGRLRTRNYRDVTKQILELAEEHRPMGWLTPGHPRVFDSVSTALLSAADARGWKTRVLPGISCFDSLLADIGYDPAGGVAMYEATGFVAGKIPLVPCAATILLQPSAFFSDKADLTLRLRAPDLAPLRDYLLTFLPESHQCAFVRSSAAPDGSALIHWTTLGGLTTVPYDTFAGSTLFLPPVSERPADRLLRAVAQTG